MSTNIPVTPSDANTIWPPLDAVVLLTPGVVAVQPVLCMPGSFAQYKLPAPIILGPGKAGDTLRIPTGQAIAQVCATGTTATCAGV